MASHYKLYDGVGEVIPFNARYSYPTQANRAWKSVVKIPPKNGSTFSPQTGRLIRIELPAQGYMNTGNSFLQFDLTLNTNSSSTSAHFQNNIQCWIRRARLLYGSLVVHDMRDYNVLVRKLTEGTGTNNNVYTDQTSLTDGVGGLMDVPYALSFNGVVTNGSTGETVVTSLNDLQLTNARAASVQVANPVAGIGSPGLVNGTRRYEVQLALGLLQQPKLVPLKWMASQVAIELELADYVECVSARAYTAGDTYTVSNVNFVAELLEFDGAYDAAFLEGLRNGGVPLKCGDWDTFQASVSPGTSQTLLIPERNRSLKAAFCVQLPSARATSTANGLYWDSHAFLESSNGISTATGLAQGYLKNFQWRIGGKYYPSQPVECGDAAPNGGVEAYQEYAKALNIVGDYRLSTAINTSRWSGPGFNNGAGGSNCVDWMWAELVNSGVSSITASNYVAGPSCFVIAADLETSDGSEISGLNGEEQNDIALMINYSAAQDSSCRYDVFVYYDVLLILRENNLVELIK